MRQRVVCAWVLVFLCLSVVSRAATSVTTGTGAQDAGIEGIPTLPGREITPQEMQKHFPASLGGSAPALPFIPDAAPLIPALPLQEADKKTEESGEQEKDALPSMILSPTPPAPVSSPTPVTRPVPVSPIPHTEQPVKQSQGASSAQERTEQQKLLEESFSRALGTFATPSEENPLGKAVISTAPAPTGFPKLELMLGQMVMSGFTGTELEAQSPIVALIKAGKVGGVFLEAVPPQTKNANAQPLLAMAQSGFTAQQSAALLAQVGAPGNIESPAQTRRLVATLQSYVPKGALPLWVAVEHEGGSVQTLRKDLGFEGLPSAAHLGQNTLENTEIVARRAGLEMGGLGINFVLGPAGDVNVNPLSENIGWRYRAFHSHEEQAAAHVMAFGRGLLAAKVVPCVRNFPGTGSYVRGFAPSPVSVQGSTNILESLADISGTWQQRELTPYRQSVQQNLGIAQGAMGVGTASIPQGIGGQLEKNSSAPLWAIQPALAYHRVLDALRPVSLSPVALKGILREQWGFQGLILSQDIRALQPYFPLEDSVLYSVLAGADILFVTEPPVQVNPASSPLAGLGGLSTLANMAGMGNMQELAGMLDGVTGKQGEDGQAGSDEEALMQMLLQNSAGKLLPGAFQAEVKAKPLTGFATQAEKVYATLLHLVKSGRISEAQIRASWLRITQAKKNIGLTP